MIEMMKIKDVASVFKIDREVLNSNWSLLLYQHELLDLNTRAYVYKIDDEVVGYVLAKYIGDTSDLLQIAVKKSFQNKKIGYELLKFVWDYLRNEGVEEMILEVATRKEKIIEFYESFGFERLYVRKNYYGRRRDALVMRLRVN